MKRWMLVLLLCMSLVCGFACAEEDDWGEEEPERVVELSPLTASVPVGREGQVSTRYGNTSLCLPQLGVHTIQLSPMEFKVLA